MDSERLEWLWNAESRGREEERFGCGRRLRGETGYCNQIRCRGEGRWSRGGKNTIDVSFVKAEETEVDSYREFVDELSRRATRSLVELCDFSSLPTAATRLLLLISSVRSKRDRSGGERVRLQLDWTCRLWAAL